MNSKKASLASALALAFGAGPLPASAASLITLDFTATFGMLSQVGKVLQNAALNGTETVYSGYRTPIRGSMSYCASTIGMSGNCNGLSAGHAVVNVVPFAWYENVDTTPFVITRMDLETIGSGPLMLANLSWDWNGNDGTPASIVLDASGFLDALAGALSTSDNISGNGALAASENINMGGTDNKPRLMPLGPLPIATTTWNTTDIGTVGPGAYPSGTLPLVVDTAIPQGQCNMVGTTCSETREPGIGGSPMRAVVAWWGKSIQFDVLSMHVTSVTAFPDTNADGDVAPLTAPDGVVDAADYSLAVQFALGRITPSDQQLAHGDIFPPGAPDGVIDTSDVVLIRGLPLK